MNANLNCDAQFVEDVLIKIRFDLYNTMIFDGDAFRRMPSHLVTNSHEITVRFVSVVCRLLQHYQKRHFSNSLLLYAMSLQCLMHLLKFRVKFNLVNKIVSAAYTLQAHSVNRHQPTRRKHRIQPTLVAKLCK